jgi:hypothetical protein
MSPKPKFRKAEVVLPNGPLTIYAGEKTRNALKEITRRMDLYTATRLELVLKAVYDQGRKDGRRELFEKVDQLKEHLNYLPPGRPKK